MRARPRERSPGVGLVRLEMESIRPPNGFARDAPVLNSHQESAFQEIRAALEKSVFETFLLHGVTGSGKTEVYLAASRRRWRRRSALLLVPEIALTPAMAGQFFGRFGDRVAICTARSATPSARAVAPHPLRTSGRRRRHAVGVFAPVRNLGLIIVDEEHDRATSRRKRRVTTAATWRSCGRASAEARASCSAPPRRVSRAATTPSAASTAARMPERIEQRPMPEVEIWSTCGRSFSRRASRPRSRAT